MSSDETLLLYSSIFSRYGRALSKQVLAEDGSTTRDVRFAKITVANFP